MSEEQKFGGYTLDEIDEFVAHSDDAGYGIDCLLGDDAAGASIIKDLVAALRKERGQ